MPSRAGALRRATPFTCARQHTSGRGAARPERLNARREIVDEAGDERRLRAGDDEIDPFGSGSRRNRRVIGDIDGEIRAALRPAGVAGRGEQALAERARGELLGQRMLARARADQENPQGEAAGATPVRLWIHAGSWSRAEGPLSGRRSREADVRGLGSSRPFPDEDAAHSGFFDLPSRRSSSVIGRAPASIEISGLAVRLSNGPSSFSTKSPHAPPSRLMKSGKSASFSESA